MAACSVASYQVPTEGSVGCYSGLLHSRGESAIEPRLMPEPDGFSRKWGFAPLVVYLCGVILPAIIASFRTDLMPLLGVPVYTTLFWAGPFVSAAAVFWSDWSAAWRAAWVLLAPAFAAMVLGAFLVLR